MDKLARYEAAIAKGEKLLDSISPQKGNSNPTEPPQSTFTNVTDLQKYGYSPAQDPTTFEISSLAEVLDKLRVNGKMTDKGGANIRIFNKHNLDCKVDGQSYKATLAHFSQVFNPTDGVLIADSNRTAPWAVHDNDSDIKVFLPLLHWSDIAFLQYLIARDRILGTDEKLDLKYVFRHDIVNYDTTSVLQQVIENFGSYTYKPWPGVTIEASSEAGKAILGTPNGSGVVHLLAQHREQLGVKTIGSIIIFHAPKSFDESETNPTLLFKIV